MRLKIFILTTVWGFVLCVALQSVQAQEKNKSLLLKRFENSNVSLKYGEINLIANDYYKQNHGGMFAIRMCSKNNFLVAYNNSKGRVARLLYDFNKYTSVPLEKINIIRGTDCLIEKSKEMPIEVWWIQNEEFPHFVEKFKACQVKRTLLEGDIKENSAYIKALFNLRQKINISKKQQNMVVGFVEGLYISKPSLSLLKNLEKAKKKLSLEVNNGSAFIKSERYGNLPPDINNSFPIIYIIEIRKQLQCF